MNKPSCKEERARRIEDKLRTRAFYMYYNKVFGHEMVPELRFVKALIASAAPIHDWAALKRWLDEYSEPPPKRHQARRKTIHAAA